MTAPTTRQIARIALLALAFTLVTSAVPTQGLHLVDPGPAPEAETPAPSGPMGEIVREARKNTDTGIHEIDRRLEELRQQHRQAVDGLNREIAALWGTLDDPPVTASTAVFQDGFDNGSRLGALGNWTTRSGGVSADPWWAYKDPQKIPDPRNGTIGDGWQVMPASGENATAAFTDPDRHGYPTGADVVLLSPVIDLSTLGELRSLIPDNRGQNALTPQISSPYVNAASIGFPGIDVDSAYHTFYLLLKHRFSFAQDPLQGALDGGRVEVFPAPVRPGDGGTPVSPDSGERVGPITTGLSRSDGRAPALDDDRYGQTAAFSQSGDSCRPMQGRTNNNCAFSGTTDGWRWDAFNLTSWAGMKVRLGFHVKTTGRDVSDMLPGDAEPGWFVDDAEVRAPTLPDRVVVGDLLSPTVDRFDVGIPEPAPGPVTFEVPVWNLGSQPADVDVEWQVNRNGSGPFTEQETLAEDTRTVHLEPGEVHIMNATINVPAVGDPDEQLVWLNVTARPQDAGSTLQQAGGVARSDPGSRSFAARVHAYDSLVVGQPVVEPALALPGDTRTVSVELENRGNVPERVQIDADVFKQPENESKPGWFTGSNQTSLRLASGASAAPSFEFVVPEATDATVRLTLSWVNNTLGESVTKPLDLPIATGTERGKMLSIRAEDLSDEQVDCKSDQASGTEDNPEDSFRCVQNGIVGAVDGQYWRSGAGGLPGIGMQGDNAILRGHPTPPNADDAEGVLVGGFSVSDAESEPPSAYRPPASGFDDLVLSIRYSGTPGAGVIRFHLTAHLEDPAEGCVGGLVPQICETINFAFPTARQASAQRGLLVELPFPPEDGFPPRAVGDRLRTSWQESRIDVSRLLASSGLPAEWNLSLEQVVFNRPPGHNDFMIDHAELTGVSRASPNLGRITLLRTTGNELENVEETGAPPSCADPFTSKSESDVGRWEVCGWGTENVTDETESAWHLESPPWSENPDRERTWRWGTDGGEPDDALVLTMPDKMPTVSNPVLEVKHAYETRPCFLAAKGHCPDVPSMHDQLYVPQGFTVLGQILPAGCEAGDGGDDPRCRWSRLHWLEPRDGYPTPYWERPDGGFMDVQTQFSAQEELESQSHRNVRPGDGFYHPSGEFTYLDEEGRTVLARDDGSGLVSSTFSLGPRAFDGTDVSGRAVRFHFVPLNENGENSNLQTRDGTWSISGFSVYDQPQARDVQVGPVSMEPDYDLARLESLGPGSTVPVRVQVNNTGLLDSQDMDLTLTVNRAPSRADACDKPEMVDRLHAEVSVLSKSSTNHTFMWTVPDQTAGQWVCLDIHAQLPDGEDPDPFDNRFPREGHRNALAPIQVQRVPDLEVRQRVQPQDAPAAVTRSAVVEVRNPGNTPVRNVEVVRTIERIAGSAIRVREDTWTLSTPLEPGDSWIRLDEPLLGVSHDSQTRDEPPFQWTPGQPGEYRVQVEVRGRGEPLSAQADNRVILTDNVQEVIFDDGIDKARTGGTGTYHKSSDGFWHTREDGGFRSSESLWVGGTQDGYAEDANASITLPTVDLTRTRSATLSFMTQFDTEKGYDGGVVEASTDDGETWHVLEPERVGAGSGYPGPVTGASPLAPSGDPADLSGAFTGRTPEAGSLDSWAPVTVPLNQVPGFTRTETLADLSPPEPAEDEPTIQRGASFYRPSWVTGDADKLERFEVYNGTLAEPTPRLGGSMWYTGGYTAGKDTTLSLNLGIEEVLNPSVGEDLVVQFWDWRDGIRGPDRQGSDQNVDPGETYKVQIENPLYEDEPITCQAWTRQDARDAPGGTPPARTCTVSPALDAQGRTITDGAWTLRNFTIRPWYGEAGETTLPTETSFSTAVWNSVDSEAVEGEAYLFGGETGSGPSDKIVRYRPDARPEERVQIIDPTLPSARTHASTVWGDGEAYIFGGVDENGNTLDEIVRFDPGSADSVETLGVTLPSPRAHTSAVWGDDEQGNKVAYVFGGVNGTGAAADFSSGDVDTVAATVAAGENHTCALLSTGDVECWGDNADGQAAGYTAGNASQVAAGERHTCVLVEEGNVDCWGASDEGQARPGFDYTKGDAAEVAAGDAFTCVLAEDDEVQCWGDDDIPSQNFQNALQIAAGDQHACALLPSGNVQCWGIGDGPTDHYEGWENVTQVAAGGRHTCVLARDGQDVNVDCRGANDTGQARQEGFDYLGGDAVQISAGGRHTCARLVGGNLECWGDDTNGQATDYEENDATFLATGDGHTCIVDDEDAVDCWNERLGEVVKFDPDADPNEDGLQPDVQVLRDAALPSPRARTSAVWDSHEAYIFGGVNGTTGERSHEILRFEPGGDPEVVFLHKADDDGQDGPDNPEARLPFPLADTAVMIDKDDDYVFLIGGEGSTDRGVRLDQAGWESSTFRLSGSRVGASAVWVGSDDAGFIFGGNSDAVNRLSPTQDLLLGGAEESVIQPTFDHEHSTGSNGNRGWAIDRVRLFHGGVETQALEPTTDPTVPEDDPRWGDTDWQETASLESEEDPTVARGDWTITDACGGNEPTDDRAWCLEAPGTDRGFPPNMDTRLVSPILDLTEVAGNNAALDLEHRWDFGSTQGGAVEVQVFNETTGRFDPWKVVTPRPVDWSSITLCDGRPLDWDNVECLPGETGMGALSFDDYLGEQQARDLAPYSEGLFEIRPQIPAVTVDRWYGAGVEEAPEPARHDTIDLSPVISRSSSDWSEDTFDLSPYLGKRVRLALHAWANSAQSSEQQFWEVRDWTVNTDVMEGGPLDLRFRFTSDGRIHGRGWGVDDLQVGVTNYDRNLALHFDEETVQASLAPGRSIWLSGTVENRGSAPRAGFGVELQATENASAVEIESYSDGVLEEEPAGPFNVAPGGERGSRVEFSFRLEANASTGENRVPLRLQLVEEPEGRAPRLVDEVGGNKEATVELNVTRSPRLDVNLTVQPSRVSLGEPVTIRPVVENMGPWRAQPTVWVNVTRGFEEVLSKHSSVGLASDARAQAFGDGIQVHPESEGTYQVTVTVVNGSVTGRDHSRFHVGVSLSAFDDGLERTDLPPLQASRVPSRERCDDPSVPQNFPANSPGPQWSITNRSGFSGGTSALFGRLPGDGTYGAYSDSGLVTQKMDLSGLPARFLSFFHQPHFADGDGAVVEMRLVDRTTGEVHIPDEEATNHCYRYENGDPTDEGWFLLEPERGYNHETVGVPEAWQDFNMNWHDGNYNPLGDGHPVLGGDSGLWERVLVDLEDQDLSIDTETALERYLVQFRFRAATQNLEGDGAGWQVDNVAVGPHMVDLQTGAEELPLTDGARKEYAFSVRNPSPFPDTYEIGIDWNGTTLPRDLVTVLTPEVDVPGEDTGGARVAVEIPLDRDLPSGSQRLAITAFSRAEPLVGDIAQLELGLETKPHPDLVGRLETGGNRLEIGSTTTLGAVVSNGGTAKSPSTTARFIVSGPGKADERVVDEVRVPPIEAPSRGGTAEAIVSTDWTVPRDQLGEYEIRLVLDPSDRALELDETNNDASKPVEVVPLQRPDLEVLPTDIELLDLSGRPATSVEPFDLVEVLTTVRNEGNQPASNVRVNLFQGPSLVHQTDVGRLEAGEEHTVSASLFAPGNTTTLTVQTRTPEVELREENNEAGTPLLVQIAKVQATLSREALELEPDGAERTVDVELHNRGTAARLVEVELLEAPVDVEVEPGEVLLAPGETQHVSLSLSARPDTPAGEHEAVLVAEQAGTQARAIQSMTLTVPRVVDYDVGVRSLATTPGVVRVPVSLENVGNVGDELVLTADAPGWEPGPSAEAALEPGERTRVTVPVVAPNATEPGTHRVEVTIDSRGGYHAVHPSDLTVQRDPRVSVDATPTNLGGVPVTYNLTVANDGNVPVTPMVAPERQPQGWAAEIDIPATRLAPGQRASGEMILAPMGEPAPGVLGVPVGVNLVGGGDSAQGAVGRFHASVDVRPPELTVDEIERTPRFGVSSGDTVEYSARVQNQGSGPAAPVDAVLYVNDLAVDHVRVPELDDHSSARVNLTYPASDAGEQNVKIAVDPQNAVREVDEQDNTRATVLQVEGGALGQVSPVPMVGPTVWVALAALGAVLLARWREQNG